MRERTKRRPTDREQKSTSSKTDDSELWHGAIHPAPGSLLSQSQTDPFNADSRRYLSEIARRSLEYTYQVVWPNNAPGIAMSRSAVQSLIHTWRRTAVQSDLKFHTHVSQAASLGYCLSEDNSDAQHDFLHLRHKHLYVSMRLTRESVAQLTGPASDDLIDDIMRVAGNGANIKRSTFCEQVPRNIPHRWICAHQDFRALRPESLPSPGSPSLGGGTGRFGHGRSDGREPHTIVSLTGKIYRP